MRISDWSSDVCSSDLLHRHPHRGLGAALHALTAGAIGVMTVGVMARASLGHTGRKLAADGGTVTIFILINLGAALRIAAPALPIDYVHGVALAGRSEEHTSELQSLMRISYAVFCLIKKNIAELVYTTTHVLYKMY